MISSWSRSTLRFAALLAVLASATPSAEAASSKFWNIGVAAGLQLSGYGVRTTVPDFAGFLIGPGPGVSVSASIFQDKLLGFSLIADYMLLYQAITFQGAPPFTYLSNALGLSAFLNLNRKGNLANMHNFGLGGAWVNFLTSSQVLGNVPAMPSNQWCVAVQWKYLFADKDSKYFFFSHRIYAGLPPRTSPGSLLGFMVAHFQIGYDF